MVGARLKVSKIFQPARAWCSPAMWPPPIKNTPDRANSGLPRLHYQLLDEMGIDFSVLHSTMGLRLPSLLEEELRRVACHDFNSFHADCYREYADRLTPAAVIPVPTPHETIAKTGFAVRVLGYKSSTSPDT